MSDISAVSPQERPRPHAAQRFSEESLHLLPGIGLAAALAALAMVAADMLPGPVMLYALLFGFCFSSIRTQDYISSGITFSAKKVLRIGVALLGVRITVTEVAALGLPTIGLVVCGVTLMLTCGTMLARAAGLRLDHAVLSSGAVAICGASAALAISAVLPQHERSERQTILTVVGVTALSTIAMLLYPMIAEGFALSDTEAGIFVGATIHDVAQVVGAGYTISDGAGEVATIVKLMRVSCLVPVVFCICLMFRSAHNGAETECKKPPLLPLFLIGFVVLVLLNSMGAVPVQAQTVLSDMSKFALVMAVAALGVKTSPRELFSVGPGPIAVLTLQTTLLAVFAMSVLLLVINL